jgi:sulfite reductase beta subunit-like hemoprotein
LTQDSADRRVLCLDPPEGKLAAAQLRYLAKIAAEKGCDFADLTTRRGIQLYGILPADESEILERLRAVGLHPPGSGEPSQDRGGCPLAGTDPAGFFDSGVHEQSRPDLFTMGIPVLAGRLESDQMRKAADLAERYADGFLHLTPRQNLLLLNVPKDQVAQILEGLGTVRLSVQASAVARALILCPSGESTARLAREWVEYLEKRVPMDRPFTIHVSGFENGCADHSAADLGLQGTRAEMEGRAGEMFDVWVHGCVAACRVPADQVRFRIEQFLMGYKQGRQAGEGFPAFCRRLGESGLAALLAEPRRETAFEKGAVTK